MDEKNERYENVLHKILKAESKAHDEGRKLRDYDECLKLLLDDNILSSRTTLQLLSMVKTTLATLHFMLLPSLAIMKQSGSCSG